MSFFRMGRGVAGIVDASVATLQGMAGARN